MKHSQAQPDASSMMLHHTYGQAMALVDFVGSIMVDRGSDKTSQIPEDLQGG